MKTLVIKMDLEKLGIPSKHFYLHDKKLVVNRIINYDGRHIAYIAEISRSEFVDEKYIENNRSKIMERYSLNSFEVLGIDRKNNKYLVLIVQNMPEIFSEIYDSMGYDAFIVTPIIISKNLLTVSVMIKDSLLEKFQNLLNRFNIDFSLVKKIDISKRNDITLKQWNLVMEAISMGYYSIPKKVKIKDIAKKFNISVPAAERMLKRVEIKAIENMFKPFL
ncbi:MAG: helix-turn-helix domain-containing protein [Thermoplasmata archaeon]|nr:helix-turn-helix domain-containing protein [Thermoplasmata archaeon]